MSKITICIDTNSNEISTITQSKEEITIKLGKVEPSAADDFINNCSLAIARTGTLKVNGIKTGYLNT